MTFPIFHGVFCPTPYLKNSHEVNATMRGMHRSADKEIKTKTDDPNKLREKKDVGQNYLVTDIII